MVLVAAAGALAQSCQSDVDCSASSNVCDISSCNTTTHTCQTTPVSCNDGNTCQVNKRCTVGVDSKGQPVARCEYDSFLCGLLRYKSVLGLAVEQWLSNPFYCPGGAGQSVLLVVSITFGATNQINLYVNPTLGGGVPSIPSVHLPTTVSVAFQSLSYLGGYMPGESSLGGITFGSSFDAVTPAA